jgi:hypothetical protein
MNQNDRRALVPTLVIPNLVLLPGATLPGPKGRGQVRARRLLGEGRGGLEGGGAGGKGKDG